MADSSLAKGLLSWSELCLKGRACQCTLSSWHSANESSFCNIFILLLFLRTGWILVQWDSSLLLPSFFCVSVGERRNRGGHRSCNCLEAMTLKLHHFSIHSSMTWPPLPVKTDSQLTGRQNTITGRESSSLRFYSLSSAPSSEPIMALKGREGPSRDGIRTTARNGESIFFSTWNDSVKHLLCLQRI